ncbi:hypothetical protein AKJ36_00875 [candidate division MSBL1 archaeon SCGC-AAA259I07]|uniref:VOC domain-containing protein n=1 Tax=candidate division MSBL1 archaeon SCGC-AAA259I07 TaxID=1698266 RepID=A0A133UM91_9EURY|nr:hypothetical protein AKJ36_00875 [candidate division MSBL1 archaeon SCGC-AAA259I07]
MIEKIDHIGIIVKDLKKATKLFNAYIGLDQEEIEYIDELKLKISFFEVEGIDIELIESLDPSILKERFSLDYSNAGVHHIAFRTEKLEMMLEKLKKQGVKTLQENPVKGARDSKIIFLDTVDTSGFNIELVER